MALTATETRLLEALPNYYGGSDDPDPTVARWITSLASECDRLRGLLIALRDRTIPSKADDSAGSLGRWERAMRLPIDPGATVEQRQAALAGAFLARNAVAGVDWRASIQAALGGLTVIVEENNPTANRLRVSIPFNDGSGYTAGLASAIIRERAPANQLVQIIYSGGFIVGESLIGIGNI